MATFGVSAASFSSFSGGKVRDDTSAPVTLAVFITGRFLFDSAPLPMGHLSPALAARRFSGEVSISGSVGFKCSMHPLLGLVLMVHCGNQLCVTIMRHNYTCLSAVTYAFNTGQQDCWHSATLIASRFTNCSRVGKGPGRTGICDGGVYTRTLALVLLDCRGFQP